MSDRTSMATHDIRALADYVLDHHGAEASLAVGNIIPTDAARRILDTLDQADVIWKQGEPKPDPDAERVRNEAWPERQSVIAECERLLVRSVDRMEADDG